ncbi:conserved proline-rich protein [Aspergillus sp. HF37]|nr:conserved proline-rich protein [Aspergillus sp. HF37]
MNQFQLFPPPSPEDRASTNPFRKGKKKQSEETNPPSPVPLEELKNPNKTEAVLFQIVEDTKTNNIQPPPRAHIPRSESRSAPRSSSRQNARPERQTSSSSAETGSTTLVNCSNRSFASPSSRNGQSPPPSRSPGQPLKSIFPRYDFNIPLSQQKYYPQSSNGPRTRSKPRELTLSPAPAIDQVLGPKTVPASATDFPAGPLDSPEIRYSSPSELKSLWEAANGQRPQDLSGTFNLRMERTEPAKFTFGNSQRPLYTLNTYSTNELCISRADPSKPNTNTTIPIMILNLEDRKRRETPNDGLVTRIFSRLAAMLAVEQASHLQKQHHLAPSEASRVEADALKRASALESHRLVWNSSQRVYELNHASLSKQKPQPRPALVGAAGVALSPVQKRYQGTLHISVSPSSASPGDSRSVGSNLPVISITTPALSNPVDDDANRAASPRTSTLPLTDSDEPLASLDLTSRTLSVSAAAILASIPSLYAIDSLVAALLAVAVSDEAANPVLADMLTVQESQAQAQCHYSNPARGKKLITTLAEWEDHCQDDDDDDDDFGSSSSPTRSRSRSQSQSGTHPPKRTLNPLTRLFSSKSSPPPKLKKTKPQKPVVEEFDLEKYGRSFASSSSSSSREEEDEHEHEKESRKQLPALVRAALRALFWALDVVVWVLGAGVKVVAWVVVHGARCVTSDRF